MLTEWFPRDMTAISKSDSEKAASYWIQTIPINVSIWSMQSRDRVIIRHLVLEIFLDNYVRNNLLLLKLTPVPIGQTTLSRQSEVTEVLSNFKVYFMELMVNTKPDPYSSK